jgi:hypothetical protein
MHALVVPDDEARKARNREKSRRYCARHPDRIKARNARRAAARQQWADENRESVRQSKRKWKQANPEKTKILNNRSWDRHRQKYTAKAKDREASKRDRLTDDYVLRCMFGDKASVMKPFTPGSVIEANRVLIALKRSLRVTAYRRTK